MYAIMRISKIKSETKGQAAAHNHRHSDFKHANVDASRSHLNHYSDGDMVEKMNALLPAKRRKDAVEGLEVLLTASPEFFKKFGSTPAAIAKNQKFRDWANDSEAWVEKTFGKENIVSAAVHLDEETPHIHIVFVPLINGRLCAKDICGVKNMINYQSGYAAAMSSHGLQRGISREITDADHTSLKEGRRQLVVAAKAKRLQAVPEKDGITDFGYTERLKLYAVDAKKTADALVAEKAADKNLKSTWRARAAAVVDGEKKLEQKQSRYDESVKEHKENLSLINQLAKQYGVSPLGLPTVLRARMIEAVAETAPVPAPVPVRAPGGLTKDQLYNAQRLRDAGAYAPSTPSKPSTEAPDDDMPVFRP